MIGFLNSLEGRHIPYRSRLANVSYLFMNTIQNIYAPEVYNKMFNLEKKEGGEQIGKYLTPYIFISILGALIASIFSEEIVKIMTANTILRLNEVVALLSMLYGTYFWKTASTCYAKKHGSVLGLLC